MAIVKTRVTVIKDEVFELELSLELIGFYSYLCYCTSESIVYNDILAEKFNITEKRVESYLQELELHNLIIKKP